jgi:Fe-S oxidoreductase
MKVFCEPRAILSEIPGVIFKEMTPPDACRGSGGFYGMTHSEASASIAKRKATDAAATGASTIATGCPARMMQLLDSTRRFGSNRESGTIFGWWPTHTARKNPRMATVAMSIEICWRAEEASRKGPHVHTF